MKLLLMFLSLAFAKNDTNLNPNCIVGDTSSYEKELILDKISAPYHLALDYDMKTLFFSYSGNGTVFNDKLSIFEMAYLHLDSKRMVHLKEVKGGFAAAVDNTNKVVYLGGDDGVYVFDWTTNLATNLKIINESIWQLFYNDGLYITTYPKGKTYWYRDKYIAELLDTTEVKMLAVDENGNIIFSNKTGLYGYHAGVKVKKFGKFEITGFSKDIKNKLYFSTSLAIYHVGQKVKRVIQIEGITGLAVERNGNFIYSTDDSIMRIKRTNKTCSNTTVKGKSKRTIPQVIKMKQKRRALRKLKHN